VKEPTSVLKCVHTGEIIWWAYTCIGCTVYALIDFANYET